jgi:uncharacterized protein
MERVTSGERIRSLDTIRGIAVMGIFSVNVVAFAMPVTAYFNPAAYGGTHGADLAVWALNFVLIDGKMRGLFTLLFGASALLVVERAEASGLSPASIHYRRMAWLLVFGLLHYYLIWFGDILTLYAVIGVVVFLFRKAPVRLLVTIGLGLLAIDMVVMLGMSEAIASAEAAARMPGAAGRTAGALRETAGFVMPPPPAALARDLALHRGSYAGLVRDQLTQGAMGPVYQLMFVWAEALGSMLLGMAALRSGFLTGAWSVRAYRRIALLGLPLGASGYAWLAWGIWQSGFDPATIARNFFALSAPFRLPMMFGYAALIILFARSGGPLAQRVAAAGRAAFTNYLGASLAASFVFMGWGLGLYGHLGRAETGLVALLFWMLMLLWSKPWLDRFLYGPFEWAWRSLARGSVQPMRRRPRGALNAAGATEA